MAVSLRPVPSNAYTHLLDEIAEHVGLEIVPRWGDLYAVVDAKGRALAESRDLTQLEFYIHGYRQARCEADPHGTY